MDSGNPPMPNVHQTLQFGRAIMELGWLEDFLALVDSGNFNRAAEMRHLTQPAFSRRIKALEDWAGVSLFDRSTHRVGLTPAGEAFCPSAEEIVRRLLQARQEVRQVAGTATTTLRFAATHALSLTFFPTWLRSVETRGAIAPIQLISDTMKACEQAMRQGQAQFLLCHSHPAVPERLDSGHFLSACIGTDMLVPVSAADPQGRPLHALPGCAAAPLPLLSYSPESALGWIVKASPIGHGAPCHLDVTVTAHLATVLKAMVHDGRGLAWLPLSLVQDELNQGTLVRAGEPEWDAEVEIHLFRSRARQTPGAETFWTQVTQDG